MYINKTSLLIIISASVTLAKANVAAHTTRKFMALAVLLDIFTGPDLYFSLFNIFCHTMPVGLLVFI